MKASRITVSRSKRGTTIKASGAAANALFSAMAAKVAPRPTVEAKPYTIHFSDHGQDFLEWDVDAWGVVVDSRPYQKRIWYGAEIVGEVKPGELVHFRQDDAELKTIKYPVFMVTVATDASNPP